MQNTLINELFFIVFRQIGFYGVFTLSGIFYIIAFLYGLFYVKEVPPKPDSGIDKKQTKELESKSIKTAPVQKKGAIADFFDLQHVYETLRIAFKSDVKYRRLKVILIMIIVFIIFGPQHGN